MNQIPGETVVIVDEKNHAYRLSRCVGSRTSDTVASHHEEFACDRVRHATEILADPLAKPVEKGLGTVAHGDETVSCRRGDEEITVEFRCESLVLGGEQQSCGVVSILFGDHRGPTTIIALDDLDLHFRNVPRKILS